VDLVGSVQSFVLLILGIASLGLTGFSALDALRYPANLFPAVGRLSKGAWVGILIAAFLISIVFIFSALSLLNIVGVVAAAVYLADVRPKLKQVSGGGGSSSGPYGPWR
jgi:hypothetical protein